MNKKSMLPLVSILAMALVFTSSNRKADAAFADAALTDAALTLVASTTAVVTPANMQGWQPQTSGTGQTVTFEQGPGNPPLGTGSVEFSVGPDGDGAAQLRHPGYVGTKLDDLTTLSYSTYVDQDGSGGQAPYIILQVDLNGDLTINPPGDRTLLFFEPVYQTAAFFPSNPQPALTLDTWQQWDALNGGWWSTTGVAGANPGTGVKPLSDVIALYPNAAIYNSTPVSGVLGGVRIVAGFGAGAWDNFIGNVDAFTIGIGPDSVTYDFELFTAPTDKAQCKNGGWATFNPPVGPFKNQGDCIQYVNTAK